MRAETAILATRIADCVVLAVPDDLSEDRMHQLEEVALGCAASASLRSMVFDMSALKYADVEEFRGILGLANAVILLGVQPLIVGLNPGIIMHLMDAGAERGRVRTYLDLADALLALGLTTDGTRP